VAREGGNAASVARDAGEVIAAASVTDNGDFEAYWAFHLRCEHHRVHQARRQDGYDLIA
jgi:hypothetical protein